MVLPGVGGYAATKAALNMLTSVSRQELEADGIAVSLVLPWITATEFGGGRHQPGREVSGREWSRTTPSTSHR